MLTDMKKLSAEDRNEKIYSLLVSFLNNGETSIDFPKPFESEEVESLFQTPIWGHREIVLTILLARLVNPKFKASENFYACNPRSIFEKPIRKALREFGIPHRKSGPLNVAKNIKKINRDWATDKRGGQVAMNVVKIVKNIETVSSAVLEKFASAFVARYKAEAKRIKDMELKLSPQENPIFIAKLCEDLINNVPDGGATAQAIVGLLMETMNNDRKNKTIVSGHLDSVSTTNTTSKKPGDIIERIDDNYELIYEVTTKQFSDDRLIESHESVMGYSQKINDVFVICRPDDVPLSLEVNRTSYIMATTQYRELSYYFVNIYDYVQSAILFLTLNARRSFYEALVSYVNETNRSERVKKYFKVWHSENKKL